MYVAELTFSVIADTDFNRAEVAIRRYIEALIFNGQVLGREFPTAWLQDSFSCRVVLPHNEALMAKHHSPKATAALNQLGSAGLAYPKLAILGMDLMSQHTDPCAAPASYILYTRFSDTCSPLRCAEHLAPVPLYLLNSTESDFEQLIRWQLQYQALDEIQMQQTRVLNKTAERSLQQLNSQLNRQGRALAKKLELSMQMPVYYALYSGTSTDCASEQNKRCPSCHCEWKLAEPLAELFDFQCQNCRLVSNIAWECQSPS
ncbi:Zn-ribbon-containing protein [Rheinheimera sp. WS51]|uniref:Zn-ribbon-containing protein n=1 Tax=Rheinheimera sp. WS51 TaxID=3425886 RepID=UPI003D91DE94